jgi:hypothetical protein
VRPFLIVLSSPTFDYYSNFRQTVEESYVKDILGVTVFWLLLPEQKWLGCRAETPGNAWVSGEIITPIPE